MQMTINELCLHIKLGLENVAYIKKYTFFCFYGKFNMTFPEQFYLLVII